MCKKTRRSYKPLTPRQGPRNHISREAEVVNGLLQLQNRCDGRRQKLADTGDLFRFFSMVRTLILWIDDLVRQMTHTENEERSAKPSEVSNSTVCRRRGQCSGNGHQFGTAGQRIISVDIIGDLTSGGLAVGLGTECSAFRAVRFGTPALRIAVVVLVLVLLIFIVVVAAVVDDDDAESVESIQTQW